MDAMLENLVNSDPILVNKKEAAALLSISCRLLDDLIAKKQLVVRRFGRRVLISRRELDKFARRDHATTKNAASGVVR